MHIQIQTKHVFSHGDCPLCFAGIGAAECAGAGRLPRSPAAGRRHRRGRLPRHAQKKTQSQAQEKCRGEFKTFTHLDLGFCNDEVVFGDEK
jgi:hypothetical protein